MKRLKVIFSGLGNAGKTSILSILDHKYERISQLTPTQGVEYSNYMVAGINASLWDMGGQITYRRRYLAEYERYFQETSVIFYIIDVQDGRTAKTTLNYIRSIIKVLKKLEEKETFFAILFHKYDPHVKNRDIRGIGVRVKNLKEDLENVLKDIPHSYFETTIYEQHSIFKAFSEALLTQMSWREILHQKIGEIAQEISSPAVMLLSNKGLVYGAWHSKDAQIIELGKFNQQTQDFAKTITSATKEDIIRLPLTEVSEIASSIMSYSNEILLLCLIVPKVGKIEQEKSFLLRKKEELLKVLQLLK